MKYNEHRGWWEVYMSPQNIEEMHLYFYCLDSFGLPSLENGWDQTGGSYRFTIEEYATAVRLRFGI